jgi:hypothetical protein
MPARRRVSHAAAADRNKSARRHPQKNVYLRD